MTTTPASSIEFCAERPSLEAFERLFRTTGWDEALDVPVERLAIALGASWHAVTAYRGERAVGTGAILSDGALHALIVSVMVEPESRGQGIGSEIMRRLVARCREAGILQIELFCARGQRRFYERLGFAARPDDGPGMELAELSPGE